MIGTDRFERDSVSVDEFTRKDAESVIRYLTSATGDAPREEVVIVDIDDYWLGPNDAENSLLDLQKLFSEQEWLELKDGFTSRAWENASRCSRSGSTFTLPHHLDFGFYTIRRDAVELLYKYGNLTKIDWKSGWELSDLQKLQRASKTILANGSVKRCFSDVFDPYSNGIEESLICFILELLWESLQSNQKFAWSNPIVIDLLVEIRSVLDGLGMLPLHESKATVSRNDLKSGTRRPSQRSRPHEGMLNVPIVQRHWAVSYWKLIEEYPDVEGNLEFIPHPSVTLSNQSGLSLSYTGRPIVGDWSLGILKGGPEPGRAKAILRGLVSHEANRAMAENAIGIPALTGMMMQRKSVFMNESEMLSAYSNAVSRRDIPFYNGVRTALAYLVRNFFIPSPGRQKSVGFDRGHRDFVERACKAIDEQDLMLLHVSQHDKVFPHISPLDRG